MSNNYRKKVDTKKKALELIKDPVCLFKLLYSKYGDIEEDYDILMTNQLVYDSSSRFNIIFKEYQFMENDIEYLKRWYRYDESSTRVPKLSDYYKNYHKFFCRPNFNDFIISSLMHSFGDDKAELFYKNNFKISKSEICDEISEKNNSSLITSIDNVTDNKTIFTKKNKFIIEGNENSINYSMTLTLNNTTISNIKNNKKNLISARSIKNSFEGMVHNLVYYQKKKDKKNKKKKSNKTDKNKKEIPVQKSNDNKQIKLINTINYLDKNKNKIKKNHNNNYIFNKDSKNPIQLTILPKAHSIIKQNKNKINGLINNRNTLKTIMKIFNSPKNGIKGRHGCKTKLEEYNNNCKNHTQNNYFYVYDQRTKTNNFSQNYSLNFQNDNVNNNSTNFKGLRKTSSHNKVKFNYIQTFKDLTCNIKPKKRKKNKTFDNNNIYNVINQVSSMPFLKYKMASSGNNNKLNSNYKSNKNIIKNNNFIGSKFNLVKNVKKNSNNNLVDKNAGKKQTSYKFYKNILTQIIPKNSKNKTSLGINNNSNSSKKNNSLSPISSNKDKAKNNINDIKSRNRKNQINNFNINFTNVFFTTSKPTYILDNNKTNNNSHVYKSINDNKNNSLNNNLGNNYFINSNANDNDNKPNRNLYVMNLKNIYNFSRNKNNILINNPLTQIENSHIKLQNNYNISHAQKNNFYGKSKDAKILLEKNSTHANINSSEDINNNKYHQEQKAPSDIINFIHKVQANYIMRNQNKNSIGYIKNSNVLNTGDMNKIHKKNNKSFSCSKNIYSSSSVSRRKNKNLINLNNCIKGDNKCGKKVNSLTSQKNIRAKHKRKIK